MKKLYAYFILFAFIIFLAAFKSADGDSTKAKTHKDIIKFSHQFHIENEVECQACHSGVEDATEISSDLLPTMDDCGECHEVEDDEECSTCHYEDVEESFDEIKSGIYFNHAKHISEQELECTNCHQGLEKVDYAFEAISSKPAMALCSDCHNTRAVASANCETCHKSTANLIPETHKLVDFKKNHQFADLDGGQECAVCHDNNFCESCHTATSMITEGNTASDFYTPYSPHKLKNDGKEQQITLVHDLNFRYTHGIEAKGKSSQCQTCHQPETFCVECHNSSNEDYAMGGTMPLSHTVPNFTTLGVGSGGGRHAIDARRDIESCVACHDVEGNDPSCIMCHTDADGVKGTNPKTHETGFLQDTHGDWHNDDAAVCFNCHTNTRTAGVLFCGYCHGADID